MTRKERAARKKKRSRLLLIGGLACLLGLGGYAASIYVSLQATAKSMYVPIRTQKSLASSALPASSGQPPLNKQELSSLPQQEPVPAEAQEPLTVLLLGIDERENDKGRSDVILVLTINPQAKSALLVSIPRDTRTLIAGTQKMDKINHAYAFGGIQQAVDTVEQFIAAPVDYVVAANMEGFAGIVDSVGGVDVENPFAFTYADYHFPLGPIHLDGKQALVYARMRYEDPRGDLGRNERQQLILKALMQKKAALASPATLNGVLETMAKYVKTNMTFADMQRLVQGYSAAVSSVETIRLEGKGQLVNGIYYFLVSPEERTKLIDQLSAFRQLTKARPPSTAESSEWQSGGAKGGTK
ncbi:LCP family glycopolymer transferase [Brevibacillus sp. SAFN-007a]|uniref:LCP family glycopolymer transferase n=1 Tax=Brevibacillus sp. SAFN-007a TaxID=3436862 RepID=UPI003F80015B